MPEQDEPKNKQGGEKDESVDRNIWLKRVGKSLSPKKCYMKSVLYREKGDVND